VTEEFHAVTDPISRIKGVSKSFGNFCVLKDLNFSASPSDKTALIGLSGSGKKIRLASE
jgi:ABC-type multidrug transport system ATPase subunit